MAKGYRRATLLWLALLWVPASTSRAFSDTSRTTSSQTTSNAANDPCLVCGEAGEIGNSSRMILTSFGMYTCGSLAAAGLQGNIPSELCSSAQTAALKKCGCSLSDGTSLSTAGSAADSSGQFFCQICPNNGEVTIPEGNVSLPGDSSNRTCSELLERAVNGLIDQDQCDALHNYTNETCGCAPPSETEDMNRPDASNTTFVCPVCGEGMTSGTPNATVYIPGQTNVRTCAQFEKAAVMGKISEQQCSMVALFVAKSCNCQSGAPATAPPTRPPGAYDCPICGEGNIVTIPHGVVSIPTQPNRTCAQLLRANDNGNINSNQCSLLQPFVSKPCGCTAMANTARPSQSPSASPTLSPTVHKQPTVSPAPTGWLPQKDGCFNSLKEIYEMEKEITDVSVRRRYTLCGGKTFQLGHISDDGRIINGDAFLMLRPNVWYQCGNNGSHQNNCVLKGGDFGLASFYGVYEGIYETIEKVRIQGITFQSQSLVAAVMEAAGDIEFIDCVFKDQANLAPVLIQWKGAGPSIPAETERERRLRSSTEFASAQVLKQRLLSGAPSASGSRRQLQSKEPVYTHSVTFRDCVFRGNRVTTKMGFPGIIENSFASELHVENCIFMDNQYGETNNPAPFGYAVRSFGPITVESSCFVDNTFRAHGPVQVYGAPHSSTQNYVASNQADLTCSFMAVFSGQDDTTTSKPKCFDSDAKTCPLKLPAGAAPTSPPVDETPTQTTSSALANGRTLIGAMAVVASILLL